MELLEDNMPIFTARSDSVVYSANLDLDHSSVVSGNFSKRLHLYAAYCIALLARNDAGSEVHLPSPVLQFLK